MPTTTTATPRALPGCPNCLGTGWDDVFRAPCECLRFDGVAPAAADRLTAPPAAPAEAAWPAPRADRPAPAPRPAPAARQRPARRESGPPATARQLELLRRLVAERDADHPTVAAAREALAEGTLRKARASRAIDALMQIPAANPTPRTNRYAGRCETCRHEVAAEAGEIRRVGERWRTFHRDGECGEVQPSRNLDLSQLPDGRYAVPSGATRLKLMIRRPTEGNWAGYVFVSDAAHYGHRRNYGRQAPGQMYRGDVEAELAAILADPRAASRAYGRLTSACGVCGRPLEDADSVAAGIGPVCAGRMGW